MKVQADNINGVYEVNDLEGAVLSQNDFYESLDTNAYGSIICAEINNDLAEKISSEYGIKYI